MSTENQIQDAPHFARSKGETLKFFLMWMTLFILGKGNQHLLRGSGILCCSRFLGAMAVNGQREKMIYLGCRSKEPPEFFQI